ncbi:hypothetical protein GCM10020000_53520 [Streptomyces olivoverticillatus]
MSLDGAPLTSPRYRSSAGTWAFSVVDVRTARLPAQTYHRLSVGSLLKLASALKTDISVILGQQAPRQGTSRDTRAALRRLSDAVHDSALGDWDGVEDPSTLADLSTARDRVVSTYWRGDYGEFSEVVAKSSA